MLRVPEILGNDIAHARDFGELVSHIGDGKIEVLRPDEEHIVGLSLPDGLEQTRYQLDQPARLLELFILLEQRDDILETRVKGIGRGNLVGDGFRAAIGRFGFGGLFQLTAERLGDVANLGLVRQRLEQPFTQDVVDFIGGQIDRRNAPLLSSQFRTGVFESPVDQLGPRVISRRQIGNHDADVFLFSRRRQQTGKGPRGDIGHGAITDLLSVEIVEVRRHFIQQDEDRLVAIEQLEPILLVGSFRPSGPKRLELISLVELIGDLTPKEVIRIVPAIERGGASALEGRSMWHSRAVSLAKFGVLYSDN